MGGPGRIAAVAAKSGAQLPVSVYQARTVRCGFLCSFVMLQVIYVVARSAYVFSAVVHGNGNICQFCTWPFAVDKFLGAAGGGGESPAAGEHSTPLATGLYATNTYFRDDL